MAGARPLQLFGKQDVRRHTKVGRGGEDDLLADVVASIHALEHVRPGIDLFGSIEQQIEDPGPARGPKVLMVRNPPPRNEEA